MTNQPKSTNKTPADVAPARLAEGTIRIEHDRKRLALAALASGLAALLVPGVFIVGHLHPVRTAPEWTLAPLCVAVLIAAVGFVRSLIRLQDGDPALVVSTRGVDFRPYLLGEIVRIPWTAIRGFKSRRYKQQRFIVFQVDDIDRYAPRVGLAGFLRRIGKRRLGADQISFSTPMAKSAWEDLEAVLQRYLEQHGRPGVTNDNLKPGEANASVAGLTSRNLQARNLP
jgi:hypothetical protein